MPRYVVHIGPMKTASTYLQKCFAGSIDQLLEAGIYYPREMIDEKNGHSHVPLFRGLRKNDTDAQFAMLAALNASAHETILLSHENLDDLPAAKLAHLRDALGGHPVEIVYAVRRWSDRIASVWNQTVREGQGRNLPEFYLNLIDPQNATRDIDYTVSWNKAAEVFGLENLRLFPYSNIVDAGDDVFARFCTDVLGMKTVPQPKRLGVKAQRSLPATETELLRALNAIHIVERRRSTNVFLQKINKRRETPEAVRVLEAIKESMATLTIDDAAAPFRDAGERMAAFADRLTGAEAGGQLFAHRRAENAYADPGYLLRDQVAALVRGLYTEMMAEPVSAKKGSASF